MVPAFSDKNNERNKPNAIRIEGAGPIPKGTYYILDRQAGGHAGCTTPRASMGGAPPITLNGLPCGM
ncbi:tlde1 domain-containing protein [Burkholderia gladioli]|uniref:tlde1 domain-containing protein n=1 Tax=Burkholderia gladioli TaxID=28095 RepID=UPI0024457137|nr:tlde1 domain-containing protein [Burkholderia gladioli]